MITVSIPNNFVAERTYAVKALLGQFCGVEVRIEIDPAQQDYILRWTDRSIVIKDHFFGKCSDGESYATIAHLPTAVRSTTAPGLEGIVAIYGEEKFEASADRIVCHLDLFAGVFFMLTRWEESLEGPRDQHQRFPASASAMVKAGFILRPVVDEYAALMRNWLQSLGYALPEDKSTYTVVPSCDVDMPLFWQSKPLWKSLGGRWLQHHRLAQTWKDYKEYKAVKHGHQQDPFDTYSYLMDLAEKSGIRFTFNFIGGGQTQYEGTYKITDPFITDLMRRIQTRGHSIGLHPSYASSENPSLIATEKKAVEQSAGMTLTTSRQHYLRFKVPDTWRYLDEAGIREDSTMGYAAEPGFRCGTSKAFPVFDIHNRHPLSLRERPLLIMDVSLRMYKQFDMEKSISLCQAIQEQVKKHKGDLGLLWHNSSLSKIDGWKGWNRVLESLMP